ncbi:MAG: hypothetical protein ACRENE_02365 [Polyangiaceae bacterium]
MNLPGDVGVWVCLGLAAAIAGWIGSVRRGPLAIGVYLVVSILGAVVAPLAAVKAGLVPSFESRWCLAFAVLGALAFLAIVHVAWGRASSKAHGLHHGEPHHRKS